MTALDIAPSTDRRISTDLRPPGLLWRESRPGKPDNHRSLQLTPAARPDSGAMERQENISAMRRIGDFIHFQNNQH